MKTYIPTDHTFTEGYGLALRIRNSIYGPNIGHGGRSISSNMDRYHFEASNTTICLSTNLGTYLNTNSLNLYQRALPRKF